MQEWSHVRGTYLISSISLGRFLFTPVSNVSTLPCPCAGRIGARVGTSMVSTGVEVEEEVAENIVTIRPKAMEHLVQLREIQGEGMMLRMGVRSGGCSGLSYVMNLVKEDDVTADDMIEEYEGIKCVIDPKSLLYLYGLELDYSDALVGGGFQFLNPNAESSCGCGKSFGV
ncbi:unnamed protein product [Discosporangium mesarthrocarpum]